PAYAETGSWSTTAATGTGYAGTDYRVVPASASETATATWTPTLPAAGLYPVYVWYRSGANRCTDALYVVRHAGGDSEVRVNQRIFGSRWFHVGDFPFAAGSEGSLVLSNRSGDAGCFVVADAVRVGAGMGSLLRGGGTSGRPRWEECARYWTEFMGAPSSVWNLGMSDRNEDITCRAHYADWMEDEWQGQGGAVYLSLHTNAAGSPNTGTGTDTFIHDTAPSPGSATFQSVLHTQVIGDVRALWKSDWTDRGQKVANFGELRETDDMPAVLIEIAFHDTQTPDNDFLHEDEFRRDVARALYKGVSKYLAPGGAVAPLPPTHLRVQSLPHGRIRVSWRAPSDPLESSAAATGYVVYASRDGVAFDNGREVTGATSMEIGRFAPGDVHYFRVAARNAGGESLPSEVLCARARFDETVPVLLVSGFDRLDRWVTLRRGENTFDYVRQHARALADAASHTFDSASNEAVVDGDVALPDYVLADWILGEESTADETFSTAEQALVSAHLASGGNLLVTGAEVAWDLGQQGSAADQTFLASALRATYRLDTPGAGIRTVEPVSATFLDGMAPFDFDDGTHGTYNVDWPDVFNPAGAGQAILLYSGGAEYAAGIAWVDGATGSRGVLLGFPLETVYDDAVRADLMSRLLGYLLP
ncbi:MAG: golvesin C-terminal-like domain-containing protein, partial [Planctomycetota bacterium]